jgi:REP element-mobilizing transposase RayT
MGTAHSARDSPVAELTKYQRDLFQRLEAGATVFITLRLSDSLPRTVVSEMRAQLQHLQAAEKRSNPVELSKRRKRYFRHFDDMLDQATTGPMWLARPDVAQVVAAGLHEFDKHEYELICYCLMPNHLHLLVYLQNDAPPLANTLQRLKSHTATKANLLLTRTGAFWHPDSYDHPVRTDEELQRDIGYVLENPVKAGLVVEWQKWPHSYWRDR